jgi:hypothetical protein
MECRRQSLIAVRFSQNVTPPLILLSQDVDLIS